MIEQALLNYETNGDAAALLAAVGAFFDVTIHEKCREYILAPTPPEGVLYLLPFAKSWKNHYSYQRLFARFGDATYPAITIGKDGRGVEFWLDLASGLVISLHHDASFYEEAANVYAASPKLFAKAFAHRGCFFDIQQLLQFQTLSQSIVAQNLKPYTDEYAVALLLLVVQVSGKDKIKVDSLPAEFIYTPCRDFLEAGGMRKIAKINQQRQQLLAFAHQQTDITALDLSNHYLTALPKALFEGKGLLQLNLSGNPDLVLDDRLSQLHTLEQLQLDGCEIEDISPLLQLPNLQSLSLKKNANLPDNTAELFKTQRPHCKVILDKTRKAPAPNPHEPVSLDLSFKKLKKIPAQALKSGRIVRVNLNGNGRLDLPAVLEQLLPHKIHLEELQICGCGLSELPETIRLFTSLRYIQLVDWANLYSYPNHNLFEYEKGGKATITHLAALPCLSEVPYHIFIDYGVEADYLLELLPQFKAASKVSLNRKSRLDDVSNGKHIALFHLLAQMRKLRELDLMDTTFSSYKGADEDAQEDNLEGLGRLPHLQTLRWHCGIRNTLPKGLLALKNIKTLDISCGFAKELLGHLAHFPHLEHLSIQSDYKTALAFDPASIPTKCPNLLSLTIQWFEPHIKDLSFLGKFPNLEKLYIAFHRSYDVDVLPMPEEIGFLGKLKELHYQTSNAIGALPESIGRLKRLEKLELHADNAEAHTVLHLPDSIGNLSALKELTIFARLDNLPDAIGNLTALETLRILDFNSPDRHFKLPATCSQLRQLRRLDLWSSIYCDDWTAMLANYPLLQKREIRDFN